MAGLLGLAGFPARAAHTQAALVLEAGSAKAGETVWAALRLRMDPGWHTYWKNAGEGGLGMPTKITWQLPPGVTAGEIHWPVPEKLVAADATTYVLSDEAALLIPLTLAKELPPGSLMLTGKVSWLECQTACVPGKATVSAQLNVAENAAPSADAGAFASWRMRLPKPGDALQARASWEQAASGDKRALLLELSAPDKTEAADFLPYPDENFEVLGKTETLNQAAGKLTLRKVVQKLEGDWPDQVVGVVVVKDGPHAGAYEVKLTLGAKAAAAAPEKVTTNPAPAAAPGTPQSLALMLIYAFIGGLILNIMPCVFPVIALKIFSFVQQSKEAPGRVFTLGLIYGLGVLVSFLAMAILVIVVKQAGGVASWGMQFKSPQVSVGFIVLVVLIALNLFGLFEVTLGGRAMGAAGQLAAQEGASGAFFNGVLATVLATPCTAPILATALGFAFAQPPLIILLFFLTIGAGLALPYVLLSWQPAWLKFLPRPGVWMEKFKIAMGFPMLATAVWIFWFTAPRFGEDGVIWIGLFLVSLAFAAWLWGEFVQRGRRRRGLAMAACLVVILGSYAFALEGKLHWRTPVKAAPTGQLPNEPEKVQWQAWSLEAVEKARREGRPVLVDFTAKWCVTCNQFVKPAVDNASVRKKLEEINGVALLADNTDYPPAVMAELQKFRADAAVPLVLVYPRDASQPPFVLPTIPSRADVLAALAKAAL